MTDNRYPPGWGYGHCGCEHPQRGHDKGCRWQLNKPRKKQLAWKVAALEAELRRIRALVDITAPREGCCIICGQPLDDTAQEAHDARCSTCYRVVFDRRREAATGEAS